MDATTRTRIHKLIGLQESNNVAVDDIVTFVGSLSALDTDHIDTDSTLSSQEPYAITPDYVDFAKNIPHPVVEGHIVIQSPLAG